MKIEKDINEDLFKRLEELEIFFNRNYINLEEYLKIKSNIIDHHIEKIKDENKEDLPF